MYPYSVSQSLRSTIPVYDPHSCTCISVRILRQHWYNKQGALDMLDLPDLHARLTPTLDGDCVDTTTSDLRSICWRHKPTFTVSIISHPLRSTPYSPLLFYLIHSKSRIGFKTVRSSNGQSRQRFIANCGRITTT